MEKKRPKVIKEDINTKIKFFNKNKGKILAVNNYF